MDEYANGMRYETDTSAFPADLQSQVVELDRQALAPEYVTSLHKLTERTQACPESFITALLGDKLTGYINFFPIEAHTLEKLIRGQIVNDIDLGQEDVHDYSPNQSLNLYIITVAILPEWQNTEVIQNLTARFADFVRNKINGGFRIECIYASIVSESGEKLFRRMGFTPHPMNPDLFTIETKSI